MALLNFKNPRKQLPGCPAGIFTDVLEFVIRSRVGESHKMQVDRVNELLDNLSNAIE